MFSYHKSGFSLAIMVVWIVECCDENEGVWILSECTVWPPMFTLADFSADLQS